ncbi:GntR family transcriptional regulator [Sporosarcina pasteurii]|uniref:Carbon starvation induced regulator n=1 Tax=Sporosarcina pasteurii TaxID=1474 RepID=A0A380C0Q0_SPOPA|nr:GntR family transcriptional regulator [Sporosarcina pasteurii]MDS9471540.1 GntR family transcriptional regulator [Sporosarcina pasteurii]SUJ10775.1 Carbon starvation induced regulator [Sporosarcina pasteurii]
MTTSITAQVTDAIRTAIITGEYEPGKQLSEAALSQYFKISRTPVREALKQLEREGLVEIIPRVGTCVLKPTEKELDELFTVKEAMEGLAAGILAEKGDLKVIGKVREAVSFMEEAVQKKDHNKFVEANNLFHQAIMDGANNSKLSYVFNLLINQIPYNRYVYLSIEVPNRLEISLKEHQIILEAILSKDRERAEKAMREHVRESAIGLKKAIAKRLYQKTAK